MKKYNYFLSILLLFILQFSQINGQSWEQIANALPHFLAAPTDIALSNSSVNENEPSGTAVGTLSATDADSGDTHTYTFTAGAGDIDNESFTIDRTALKTAISFDFETKASYSIRLKTDDSNGGTFEKEFTITINNVNDAPTLDVGINFGFAEVSKFSGEFTYSQFGRSVAIDGDYTVVGDPKIETVYVLQKTISGWQSIAKLTPSDKMFGDEFGFSVAISGDQIVVGAYRDDYSEVGNSGSAYVFVKPTSGWVDMTQTAKILPSNDEAYSRFGHSVGISGDQIVVGAYGGIGGSSYVFEKPNSGWANMTQTAKLVASDAVLGDNFGWSVAISGDQIVVGARWADDDGDASGSAYIFEKPNTGWADMSQTAKILPSDGGWQGRFGNSVAISSNQIVVGALRSGVSGNGQGAGYVFIKPSSGWIDMTQTAKLTASDGKVGSFGQSIAISDDKIVVGARTDNVNGTNSGSAYVFVKPSDGWVNMTQTAKIIASDGAESDWFGLSVGVSGDQIIVGALSTSGSAYFFGPATAAIPNHTAHEDVAFSFTFDEEIFIDADVNDVLTYSASLSDNSALPTWLSYDVNTKIFSGTPTNNDVGTITIKVTATDIATASVSDEFDLEIINTNDTPVVANEIPDQVTDEDALGNFQFAENTFNDIDLEDVLTYSASLSDGTALPNWLSFDADTRNFSGVPKNSEIGTITIKVTATDITAASVSDEFDLEVINVNDAPVMSEITIDSFCPESTQTIDLSSFVTDVDNDVATEMIFTFDASNASAGFEISLDRAMLTFTHNATEAATYEISVTADDQSGGTVNRAISITTFYLDAIISDDGNVLTSVEGESYKWFLNGNEIANTSQIHSAITVGDYTVQVTHSGDCIAQSEAVTIDAVTDLELTDISNQIAIYPNPTSDFLNISSSVQLKKTTQIQLFDVNGKEVFSSSTLVEKVDMSQLSKGIYILQLVNENSLAMKKVVRY